MPSLVGSEMCIRDRAYSLNFMRFQTENVPVRDP